jgi:hypothetical protein
MSALEKMLNAFISPKSVDRQPTHKAKPKAHQVKWVSVPSFLLETFPNFNIRTASPLLMNSKLVDVSVQLHLDLIDIDTPKQLPEELV